MTLNTLLASAISAALVTASGAAQAQSPQEQPARTASQAAPDARSVEVAEVDASSADRSTPAPPIPSQAPLEAQVRIVEDLSQSRVRAALQEVQGASAVVAADQRPETPR